MTEKQLLALIAAIEAFEQIYQAQRGSKPARRAVQAALMSRLGIVRETDLLDHALTVEAIAGLLAGVALESDSSIPVETVRLEEAMMPAGLPQLLLEQEVKFRGEVWVVHKADADPFPSDPHAHCQGYDVKLHLGTGVLYRKHEAVDTIRWKHLLKLRRLIVYRPLPPLDKLARALAL